MLIPKDLYNQICQVMPIPCVDLLVSDESGRILLVKRKNEPMRGEWWFPGGRVHSMETRFQAVVRKLKEKCNLEAQEIKELGTHDMILDLPGSSLASHCITTLFFVSTRHSELLRLDGQSTKAEWQLPIEWQNNHLHAFVQNNIAKI